jgi:ribokinase
MPEPGQTILGSSFVMNPGGKGANQAVAAARLGAECHFVGRVGADEFGERMIATLQSAGVDTQSVAVTETVPPVSTGVAMIVVDQHGENSIVVAGGANNRVDLEDIANAEQLIASADALLVQLELPVRTVCRAIQVARERGVLVVLDPAPISGELPAAAYDVDILNPNQVEASQLAGENGEVDHQKAKTVATELIRRGAGSVVVKLGRNGAVAVDGKSQQVHTCPGFEVAVVDTTAAGDAFAAAVTVARAEGSPLDRALTLACGAGALACTQRGAISAMPTREQVEALISP